MKKQFTIDWMLILLLLCALVVILVGKASQSRQFHKNSHAFNGVYSR
ncbi:hypothetical protein SAMN04488511_10730 [Pedobacter suwonensis]|uniref:Uncharacterized protein n=1 Tax=Pedobacter suwonensis TaxID=332999 RepID=A0A1I0T8U0_9SPHI|nr:hypothetical protein [Pedobacter suwonensis]SFA48182.1 hypothetical protein SAMN04488511_10730 [Pedobacter suwonensis]